jgi:hypothetical protein
MSESSHRTKVYRRDDRGIVGVEPPQPAGLGSSSSTPGLDVRPGRTVPAGLQVLCNAAMPMAGLIVAGVFAERVAAIRAWSGGTTVSGWQGTVPTAQ